MCHPSTFLSFLHVINSTSSVLSPQKRFMTLVCQMRHGDQVALGSTAGGIILPIANSFWVALLHPGPSVKINGTHQYINQAVSLGGAIPNYSLEIIPNLPIGNPGGTRPRHAFLSNCAIREIFCVSVKTFQQGLRHFTGIGGFLPRRNGGTLSISIRKGQANRKSFGTEWRVRWTVCIIENRSIVWEGEAVFGCFPVWWETLLRCEMLLYR